MLQGASCVGCGLTILNITWKIEVFPIQDCSQLRTRSLVLSEVCGGLPPPSLSWNLPSVKGFRFKSDSPKTEWFIFLFRPSTYNIVLLDAFIESAWLLISLCIYTRLYLPLEKQWELLKRGNREINALSVAVIWLAACSCLLFWKCKQKVTAKNKSPQSSVPT